MPPFHPTPREILLLVALFGCLLFFTANLQRHPGHASDLTHSPYVVEDEVTAKPLTLETQYTLQALNVPLSWGAAPVPETKIIAHVPGEPYFRSVRAYESSWFSPGKPTRIPIRRRFRITSMNAARCSIPRPYYVSTFTVLFFQEMEHRGHNTSYHCYRRRTSAPRTDEIR